MLSREFLKAQNVGHIMAKSRNAFKSTKPTNPHEYPFQVFTYPLFQNYVCHNFLIKASSNRLPSFTTELKFAMELF